MGIVTLGNIVDYEEKGGKSKKKQKISKFDHKAQCTFFSFSWHSKQPRKKIYTSVSGRLDLISILVRDLNRELLLNGHHDLNSVQRVQAEVLVEVGRKRDLFYNMKNRVGLEYMQLMEETCRGIATVASAVTYGRSHVRVL